MTGRRLHPQAKGVGRQQIRVAHLVETWLNPSEEWLAVQIAELAPCGVSGLVVAMREFPGASRPPNIEFRSVFKPVGSGIAAIGPKIANRIVGAFKDKIISGAIHRHRDTIVHSHFGNLAWTVADTVSRLRLPHVVSFYGYDATLLPRQDPSWRERYATLFRLADRVLCEGPYFAQTLMALGCPEQKIVVHSLGVRLPELPFRPKPLSDGETVQILIAGRFVEKKGIEAALEATRRLAAERSVSVTLVGSGDSESEGRIERLCRELSAVAEVRRFGFLPISQLRDIAAGHHLFFAASVVAASGDQEGGAPVTAIEMQALGLGVIATRHCDLPYVLEQGVPLSPERDVDDLVRQLKDWTDHPDLWIERTLRGRRHVEQYLDSRVQAAALADLYRSTLAGRSMAPRTVWPSMKVTDQAPVATTISRKRRLAARAPEAIGST